MKKEDNKHTAGFTLIEVIVAVSVFVIVITIASGALVNMVNANKRSRNAMNTMDNMRVIVDTMTREIRDGSNYSCTTGSLADCFENGSNELVFVDDDGNTVIYRHENYTINHIEGGTAVDMTGTNVEVRDARFYVVGGAGAGTNPQVRMVLQLESGDRIEEDVELNVQTSVAHRPEPSSIFISN